MSGKHLDAKPEVPEDLLSGGHEGLDSVADEALISAYERLRDQEVPSSDGTAYPNLRLLYRTPFEREKDRREVHAWAEESRGCEMQEWYEEAQKKPCTWWVQNHLVARHALRGCMACGVCTSQCPAAEFFEDYNPRVIVEAALSNDEARLMELLQSEVLWYCGQCGSCVCNCPEENNLMGLVSSLRFLAQLKGYHLHSARGRQQYAARHLWGGNLWNRACSLYFRNLDAESHPDYGPRHAKYQSEVEQQMSRVGADPDTAGRFGGRKVPPATLEELRKCLARGGTLALWERLEELALAQARARGISVDAYHDQVRSEG